MAQSSEYQTGKILNTGAVQFRKQNYLVVDGLLSKPLLGMVYTYAKRKSLNGTMLLDDGQVPGTPSCYGDTVMDMLLQLFRPRVEMLTGLKLHPTYSYFRIYQPGDVLKAHKDRPACEISLTLTLGFEAAQAWPIFFEVDDQPVPVDLLPGDGAIFRGTELKHWREPFAGTRHASVFLHYVDQNGPCAEWKYDKRNAVRSRARRMLARAGGTVLRPWASTGTASR